MNEWWRGSVIYQIYPRSFYDSNEDGVGDLAGITSKIDYIKSLGVDGIWLSPFFRSPMKDFGYDVSDYRDVDPVFGTLEDFDLLLEGAHDAGLKVIIDQVYSHTSEKHEWFAESRTSRDNSKADWYVWADAKSDGSMPNNWLAIFGGPAWSWDTQRQQYYMHNFLSEQPDLNFHSPEVQAEILDVAKFWLDRGIDGFRLDVANFYFCDQELKDNPPKKPEGGFDRPYKHQLHLNDRSQPENIVFMEKIRSLLDQYEDKMAVAEIGSESYIARSIEYTLPNRLHTAYNFMLLENGPLTAKLIRDALKSWTSDEAWPSWSFSNHDVERSRSRWGGIEAGDEFTRMLINILMCLRGTIFLYQGEELGLPQGQVPYDKLQDPEAIRFWPNNLGRDGCRTPIPWKIRAPYAGFSQVEPWLPIDAQQQTMAVDVQEGDASSCLAWTKKCIHFRKEQPALRLGSIEFIETPEPILAFRRTYEGETLVCIFNLSGNKISNPLAITGKEALFGSGDYSEDGKVALPAFGGLVIRES